MQERTIEAIKSKEDFLCLLFIYCSYLDHDFSEAEEILIVEEYGYDVYAAILSVYEELPKEEVLPVLLDKMRMYYPSKLSLEELNNKLYSIFSVDGHVCRFETSFQEFINQYMENV